jgi:hypothetical protein
MSRSDRICPVGKTEIPADVKRDLDHE